MHSSTKWTRRALVAGGSAAALLLGSAGVAGSSPTGDDGTDMEPALTATLSPPILVVPGGQVTYSSVDPCPLNPDLRVLVEYAPDVANGHHHGQAGHMYIETEEDGSWSVTLPAAGEEPPELGTYEITAQCVTSAGQDPETGLPDPSDIVVGAYYPLTLDVAADGTPEPTTEAPAPARPVPAQPSYAG
jgi:hypothetical protein